VLAGSVAVVCPAQQHKHRGPAVESSMKAEGHIEEGETDPNFASLSDHNDHREAVDVLTRASPSEGVGRPKVNAHNDEIAQGHEMIRRSRRLIAVSGELVATSKARLIESQKQLRVVIERGPSSLFERAP
jgi:hypothetical protein